MVGCVIVRDGEVVGEGWHQRAGDPHAEGICIVCGWRPRTRCNGLRHVGAVCALGAYSAVCDGVD